MGDHRLLDVFARSGVETRYFAFPPSYYVEARTFEQRNRDFVQQALVLGERAIRDALQCADVPPQGIDHFYFVTTTGLATPSVDAQLAHQLGLRRDVFRNPLFGIGCAGGAAAIARASEVLRGRPRERALVLSVELCGQTFRRSDTSAENYVGAALFGDGAAAAVIAGDDISRAGPVVVATGAELFPETGHVMGWDFKDDGMKLVLTQEVPATIEKHVLPAVTRFLAGHGLERRHVRHFILHPGGTRVLRAYRDVMGLTDEQVRPSRECLRTVGNLSSAAVLFVLASIRAEPGDVGIMAAVGPGFAVEMSLLRW